MLENPRSPRVRAVAKLAKRSARDETGLFLLEGPQAVREALAFRPEVLVDLFATPTALARDACLPCRERIATAERICKALERRGLAERGGTKALPKWRRAEGG